MPQHGLKTAACHWVMSYAAVSPLSWSELWGKGKWEWVGWGTGPYNRAYKEPSLADGMWHGVSTEET